MLHERFTTTGIAPARSDAALTLALIGGASLQLFPEVELTLDLGRTICSAGPARGTAHRATLVALGGLGLAYAW